MNNLDIKACYANKWLCFCKKCEKIYVAFVFDALEEQGAENELSGIAAGGVSRKEEVDFKL